jgi:hypothetical protein
VTLELKYKLIILIFGGARHHLISDAHAELTHQFLMRTLSARISSLGVCSAYASVPARGRHKFLTRMLSMF